jgi:hypothetical protein
MARAVSTDGTEAPSGVAGERRAAADRPELRSWRWQMSESSEPTSATWSEVGEQFETLGETIAEAFRAAWEREDTRHHVEGLKTGLEGLVGSVEQAISEFGESAEGERVKAEAQKAADSARAAGEKAWEDAQPHILSALQRVNEELRKVTSRIQGSESEEAAEPEEDETA